MILLQEALQIHDILIEKFGGGKGVRDQGSLEAALSRPFATFGGQDLYLSPIQKAAALIESVLINHPFIDANKRTGYVLMRLLLLQAGLDIPASQAEKYDFVISIAKGTLKFEGIAAWLEEKKVNAK